MASPIDTRSATISAPLAVLTLEEAYARARTRSDELATYAERVVEAELNVDRAWSLLHPTWNASFTFTHTEPQPPAFQLPAFPNLQSEPVRAACVSDGAGSIVDPQGCVTAVIGEIASTIQREPMQFDFVGQDTALFNSTITWNVFNGRALPLIASAKDSVEIERERERSGTIELLLGVARAYYAAVAARQAVAAAERARARAQAELAIAERQSELGETLRARVTAARIAARQGELDVARAGNGYRQAVALLQHLTRTPEPIDVVVPPDPVEPSGGKEELVAGALSRREDLRAAELGVRVAERLGDEAWWRFAPIVSLFGSYRYSNIEGISGQNEQWSFGVNAALPLYDGGLRYAELDSAESKLRSAGRGYLALRARVASDVERALLGLEASELSAARAASALELARQRAELTAAQYEVGALRTIELQQANDAVLDAELGIIRARLERALAVLELQRAAGLFAP